MHPSWQLIDVKMSMLRAHKIRAPFSKPLH